jgi:hypothetical protein
MKIPARQMPRDRGVVFLCLAVAAAFLSGCVQLETRIRLNEAGGATVTERLEILPALLEMEAGATNLTGMTFERLLSRERALERATDMGKGVTLVSHNVHTTDSGSREAVAVYQAADITTLTYMSPFFGKGMKQGKFHFSIEPQYADQWRQVAGILMLRADYIDSPLKPDEGPAIRALGLTNETPLLRQAYRDVAPAFRDLLGGFKIRVAFENYGEILGIGGAGDVARLRRPNTANMVNYAYGGGKSGEGGTHPLDDEEVMVDLLKLRIAGEGERYHCQRIGEFLGKYSGRQGFTAAIRPSRPLFDKYFAGKELKFGMRGLTPAGTRKADFAEIGETAVSPATP